MKSNEFFWEASLSKAASKLSFVESRKQCVFEFNRAFAEKFSTPPSKIIKSALSKLEGFKKNGDIDFIVSFEKDLQKGWKAIKSSKDPNEFIRIVVAVGVPKLKGLRVTKAKHEGELGRLTISASSEQASKWDIRWIELIVEKKLQDLGVDKKANRGVIHAVFYKAANGFKVFEQSPTPDYLLVSDVTNAKLPFFVIKGTGAEDVVLGFLDVTAAKNMAFCQKVVNSVAKYCNQLAEKNGRTYAVQTEHIIERLQSAYHGPEKFGVGLPFIVYVASSEKNEKQDIRPITGATSTGGVDDFARKSRGTSPAALRRQRAEALKNAPAKEKPEEKPKVKPKIPLDLEFGPENIWVRIKTWDMDLYRKPDFTPNIEWIKSHLDYSGVNHGATDEFLKSVENDLNEKKDPKLEGACSGR